MSFAIFEEHVESFNKSPINIDILLQYNPQKVLPIVRHQLSLQRRKIPFPWPWKKTSNKCQEKNFVYNSVSLVYMCWCFSVRPYLFLLIKNILISCLHCFQHANCRLLKSSSVLIDSCIEWVYAVEWLNELATKLEVFYHREKREDTKVISR